MEDLLLELRSKTHSVLPGAARRSSECVSLAEGVKRELQSFAKTAGVFGSPVFSVAVLLATNAVRRRCTLSDILAANEDAVAASDAVKLLVEFRRTTKHQESVLLLDCLLSSLVFWRRLETRVQKICYLVNFPHSEFAYLLVVAFVLDNLKTGELFVPKTEFLQNAFAAASAVLTLLSSASVQLNAGDHSRLDELNMRLAFLEWLQRSYSVNEASLASITEKLPVQLLLNKVQVYADTLHSVKRGSSPLTVALLPWSPLEVANFPEAMLLDIESLATWPEPYMKRSLTDIQSSFNFSPIKRRVLPGLDDYSGLGEDNAGFSALNEAQVDRARQQSRVLLKRTNTIVPDSPYKRKLQRYASAPAPEPEALHETPPRPPPAKRSRVEPAVATKRELQLQFRSSTGDDCFSLSGCVLRSLTGVWAMQDLHAELVRLGLELGLELGLGLADADAPDSWRATEDLVDLNVRQLVHGGPLRSLLTSARKREQFGNLVKLVLALAGPAERLPLGLSLEAAVKASCVLLADLLQAENFLEIEPGFAGVPQYPTVLSVSAFSGYGFATAGVWLAADWLELYTVAETLMEPTLNALVELCMGKTPNVLAATPGTLGQLRAVKEELLRQFVFREESSLWSGLARLRRQTMRANLAVTLEASDAAVRPLEEEPVLESCVHVVFLFGCIKLLDVTSRCALGNKTACILNLTVDLFRAVLLYKTQLLRNRDLYEILACALVTAARLFKNKLSFQDLRQAFSLSLQTSTRPRVRATLSLTFDHVPVSSDSLHSGLLAFEGARERGSDGRVNPSVLDAAFPTTSVEDFHTSVFLPETETFLAAAHRVVEKKHDHIATAREGEAADGGFLSPDASPYSEPFFGEILRSFLRRIDRNKDEYSLREWRKALEMSSPLGHLDCLFPVLPGPGRSRGGFAWIKGVLVKEQGEDIQVITTS